MQQVQYSHYLSLPESPGVYLFLDKKGNVLYVGKAKNLKKRVSSYFTKELTTGTKTRVLVRKIATIQYMLARSEVETLLLEANYIKKYTPFYNVKLTDGKSYPLIRITKKDAFPKVLIARRPGDPRSIYFGPYPNAGAMKLVLRILRRIFPYESVLHHQSKVCFYNHLGLCPCLEVSPNNETKLQYRKNISYIIKILEGKTGNVLKELQRERNALSASEEFEKAAQVHKSMQALSVITNPVYKPFDYEVNPNLTQDIAEKEVGDLKTQLALHGVKIKQLDRIECYDISNISGKHATGSMVVFENGEKNNQAYRRFKIKYTKGPNDFEMMQEVLQRRFSHTDWVFPDLVIVDGGKGQISRAKDVIEKLNLGITVVGLAKRYETIITSGFSQINLPKRSPALALVMRIRDEAHRFAITYHKKLRSKAIAE